MGPPESSEFDTGHGVAGGHQESKLAWSSSPAAMALRNGALEALVELVDGDPPASPGRRREVERTSTTCSTDWRRSGHRRAVPGGDRTSRGGAVTAVKADLALRAWPPRPRRLRASGRTSTRDRAHGRVPQGQAQRASARTSSRRDQDARYAQTGRKARPWNGLSTTWNWWTRRPACIDRALLEPDLDQPEPKTSTSQEESPETGET